MAIFDGQTSDETDWTLSLSTSVGSGCGPWTIYDWSLTLDGPVALIFENGFESGDLGAWSTSVGVLP